VITLNELLQTFGLGKLAHVVVPQTTTIKEDFPEVDDREEAMPQLIKEFTFRADFGDIRSVGVGPFGDRTIITVRGGRFRGARLNGSIVGPSGDWLLQGADEFGRIDARFTLTTTDGASIYMQFVGLVENTAPVRSLSDNGIPTKYGDLYFFINPRLETGHKRYAWVNRTIFVGQGRFSRSSSVKFRVYRVANP
jgi:Protein of unknown function (DUF3237)